MRKVISLLLTIAMVLSLMVVASATSTENASVYLKTKKVENGNNTVTYTFTLDTGDSDGVGALSFYVATEGLTYKSKVYNDGGTGLDKVFKPSVPGVTPGFYGFYENTGRFYAYGGDSTATPPRVLKGSVVLVAVTYTINDAGYSLTVKTGKEEGFKACLSGKQAALETERYNCKVEPIEESGSKGVTVSGTALSWNNTDDAVYLLYPAATTDDAIKTEWKNGSNTGTACTSKGDIAVSGKQYGQSFTFDNVAAGDYKLAILKPGKYVPKIMTIAVGSTDLALGEMKLWLYGDVNYDGKVNATDATQILRYFNNKAPNAFTSGTEQDQADRFLCADVNGDKNINGTDATQVRRYFNNKTPNAFANHK